jgi:hypothetical protein
MAGLIFTLSENAFSESAVTYKTGSYEIPVYAYEALEYKLGILKGDTVTIGIRPYVFCSEILT